MEDEFLLRQRPADGEYERFAVVNSEGTQTKYETHTKQPDEMLRRIIGNFGDIKIEGSNERVSSLIPFGNGLRKQKMSIEL